MTKKLSKTEAKRRRAARAVERIFVRRVAALVRKGLRAERLALKGR